jgi:hypothetical protein
MTAYILSAKTGIGRQVVYLVNVTENSTLNTLVLNNLANNSAISSTNDQDLLWVWVGVHGQMSDHLLVGEFITLSALDGVIEYQDMAVVGRFENEDILVFALLVVKDLLDFESHGLARPHVVGDFAEPSI